MATTEVEDFPDIDAEDMYDSLKGSMEGPLDDSLGTLGEEDQECDICNNKKCSPRLLSCLHTFCEQCLDKLLIDASGDSGKVDRYIVCPTCEQETKVGGKGASTLPCDYVSVNLSEPLSLEKVGAILCTACTTQEAATTRCMDCSGFLCSNCQIAHRFMRCFENHRVVKIEDLSKTKEKIVLHRHVFCQEHPQETIKYFCFTCQVPICNECLAIEHKGPEHHYEHVAEAEARLRKELDSLMKESKSKEEFCDQASTNLENGLEELQHQRDTARDLINESFQSYKAVLEKCRDDSLSKLESLHSERRLKIMDLFHNVEKTVDRIEDACKFTTRLLHHANGSELITLKKVVSAQFLNLINNTPKPDINYILEFETNFDKFEQSIKHSFGEFRTESTVQTPKETSPPPILPCMPPVLNHRDNNKTSSGITMGNGSVTTSSPISLPTSMQSSFDGDFNTLSTGYSLPSTMMVPDSPPHALPSVTTSLQLSSIAEYNLQQLASLAEKTEPFPSSASSPSPSFSISDVFMGDINSTSNALNNLQALAKLGLNSHSTADLSSNMLPVPSPNLDNGPTSLDLSSLNGYSNISASVSPNADELGSISGMGGSMSGSMYSLNRTSSIKLTPMQIRCKFGQLGPTKGQFNSPHGFCLGNDEDIVVADTNNHRIEVFEKTGTFKFQFGIPGKEEGQLWYPRKVAVMRSSGKFVVCDRGNERSRMQIFTKNGHFIKKIAIRYIDIVAGLAVTSQGHIVAVDSVSPTVFVISESGDLLRWFDCSDFMREPSDIAINGKEFYVCDFKGHCVVVFSEDGIFQRRIGNETTTNFPNGIDISDAGDVLIGDSHGNRFHVAVYTRDGSPVSEFECPYVKVSRCCGLKITSEGYIVTLAKNNHHVLVLNTLYIV